jgi:hypothetical protein
MERIELADHPHQQHRRWELEQPGHWRHQLLEAGTLADDRWYVARTSRRGRQAWVAGTERQAAEAVEKWLRRLPGCRETTGQDA